MRAIVSAIRAVRLKRWNRWAAAVLSLAVLIVPSSAAAAGSGPTISLSAQQAGPGSTLTVTGQGWRGHALLTLLVCGQDAIGGTDSCDNSTGRAVTTDASGAFHQQLPVADPPKPCPCMVHVATVLGDYQTADAPLVVSGHPVAALPPDTGGGLLTALAARLDGSSGLLTWFGAPPSRQLVVTVGNLASDPAKNPVFQVGIAHGVYAPQWNDEQWQGTVQPGQKAEVSVPVELAAGAHGDYQVTLKYAGKVLAVQPWGVSRPWGVTLFWVLLFVVVPTAIFRIGMATVDRLRPRRPGTVYGGGARRPHAPARPARPARLSTLAASLARAADAAKAQAKSRAKTEPDRAPVATSARDASALPWFTPDTSPTTTPPSAPSAPSATEHSTAKGSP
ncbi:hypothetical protein NGB36_32240 [Streptomyces sp. RB6PN25]|uniref:Neocarzinostatin family protein n=1 Tax=Streptomyces humicola TaxID=2953240 RepID=A0ABT1Q5B0_9ACTN|nr:hypothetical protein [Streptomyces humicola]MCQ4085111.1 hypothetical protein [Streptomyces humicola]